MSTSKREEVDYQAIRHAMIERYLSPQVEVWFDISVMRRYVGLGYKHNGEVFTVKIEIKGDEDHYQSIMDGATMVQGKINEQI
jgi:hypothetical protein